MTPLIDYSSLQDLGDLQQLLKLYSDPMLRRYNSPVYEIVKFLGEALSAVVQETMIRAQQHEADGRYRDAEYLFRRANSIEDVTMDNMDPYRSEDALPRLVTIYEKSGDYPAAEKAQETLLRRLFKDSTRASNDQIQAVYDYSRLLSCFQKRILDLNPHCLTSIDLLVTHRAAVLDIIPLNEVLLEQGLITFESNAEQCCTSLHIAAREGAINLARLLIKNGTDINSRDIDSRTPLHIAAQYAESRMIRLLLVHCANVEAVDELGRTPLHAACDGEAAQECVAILLDAGANVDARDEDGFTVLETAIRDDQSELALLLLARGANVENRDHDGRTPLFIAVEYKRDWAIKSLLENGADLATRNAHGNTALYDAVDSSNESVVRTLLDHGAMTKTAVDQGKGHGDALLHCAVRGANVAILEMLLEAGADIHERGYAGETALHQVMLPFLYSGIHEHIHIVCLLLTHSAPVDAVNRYGDTVLHYAVLYKRRHMVEVFLRQVESDKLAIICQMRNNDGQTPLDMARVLAKNRMNSSDARSILDRLELYSRTSIHLSSFEMSPSFALSVTDTNRS